MACCHACRTLEYSKDLSFVVAENSSYVSSSPWDGEWQASGSGRSYILGS